MYTIALFIVGSSIIITLLQGIRHALAQSGGRNSRGAREGGDVMSHNHEISASAVDGHYSVARESDTHSSNREVAAADNYAGQSHGNDEFSAIATNLERVALIDDQQQPLLPPLQQPAYLPAGSFYFEKGPIGTSGTTVCCGAHASTQKHIHFRV